MVGCRIGRVGLLGTLTLGLAAAATAEPSSHRCPDPGVQLTYSYSGGAAPENPTTEAVESRGGTICRFRYLNTNKVYDRVLGAFDPTAPLVKANLEKFQSLAALQVGQKIKVISSGASVTGADGTWFHEVSIERSEPVTTPAGTFSSVVILHDEQTPQFTTGRWQRRYWYSAEVGYVVKFEYRTIHGNPSPNYPRDWILIKYKKPGPAN